ncbi:MAG: hypothetical protein ACK40G_18175 [Cytophagaceae bacterium]
MIRFIFLYFLLFFISSPGVTQKVDVSYSIPKPEKLSKTCEDGFVGKLNGEYLMMMTGSSYYFEKIDNNLSSKGSLPIKFIDGKGPDTHTSPIIFNDKLIQLGAKQEKKSIKYSIFFAQVKNSYNELSWTKFYDLEVTELDRVYYTLSPGRNFLLVTVVSKNKTESPSKVSYFIFDRDFKLHTKLNLNDKVDIEGHPFYVEQLDDTGKLFVFITVEEKDYWSLTNFKYKIISWDGNRLQIYQLPLESTFISSFKCKIMNGQFIGAGNFCYQKPFNQEIGIYFFRLDIANENLFFDLAKFPEKILLNYISQSKIDKGFGVNGFRPEFIALTEDNSLFFVYEFQAPKVAYDNPGYTYYWEYDDILVTRISPDNKIEWINLIPKTQYSSKSASTALYSCEKYQHYAHFGISCMVKGNSLHIVYNEDPENLSPNRAYKDWKKLGKNEKCVQVVTSVNSDGSHTTQVLDLKNFKPGEIALRPQNHFWDNDDGSLILLYEKGNSYGFMKVSIND